ncbi:Zinc/iron permease [Aspergillus granulosus]|uniref:Zinc/iron permease n=1 Tax=Aspergillus granulosus TaxID=176169 RepID=A0ABR4HGY4_9EURO
MVLMAASSDLRGWVMSAVSGAACVLGSSLICLDLLVRRFSPRTDFQIAHSNVFLSASLCLSAGVILFTSLYSMLPTARDHLEKAGWSPARSAYALIALFIAGVVGIRALSAMLHKFLPSHVVDCAHSHGQPPPRDADLEHGPAHSHPAPHGPNQSSERTPLLSRTPKSAPAVIGPPVTERPLDGVGRGGLEPWRVRLGRRLSGLFRAPKSHCDENGPCYGFSQTCGDECSKTLVQPAITADDAPESDIHDHALDRSSSLAPTDVIDRPDSSHSEPEEQSKPPPRSGGPQHHHHVPQNAFLSIGLQTSVAIALHKLPEGFITYATNHASPTLGMTVFLALFIHNISEGFAMALPLYLAIHSRGWAMFWSSLLGGISQPAGAGLAALWIWGARKSGSRIGDGQDETSLAVYGCMFAVTAGVMTSVGLQLLTEGLVLTHQRNMAIGFAIGGMGLMGLSFALTAS